LQVGDLEELKAVALAFGEDRKTPLLIGSVRSNMGHTERAVGLCGVTKVFTGMETGCIPLNLHYNSTREGVDSLMNGRLRVNIDITTELLYFYSLVLSLHPFNHFMAVDAMVLAQTDMHSVSYVQIYCHVLERL
jgi:hypothetical protein